MRKPFLLPATAITAALLASAGLTAEEPYPGYGYGPTEGQHLGEREYSPYLDIGYPQRVFWGHRHLHSAPTPRSAVLGNRLGPEEAGEIHWRNQHRPRHGVSPESPE